MNKIDENGLIKWVNMTIATGHNSLAMNLSVRQVAQHYVKGSRSQEGMLNRVEAVRGDDAFGWHAAHHLLKLAGNDSVQVLATHQLTPELAEPISQADLVIFIDASEFNYCPV